MNKKSRTRIPGRYLAKLLAELLLLSLGVIIYSSSEQWIDFFRGLGPVTIVILHFLIFLFGASLMVRVLAMIYRSRKHLPYNKKDNVTTGLSNLFVMVIFVYGFISVFGLFGISLGHMFTTLSIVAAALAIISKDFIADIISGIVISFSKEISINDYVKIGEHKGKIVDINISKTELLNEDDDIMFIPNIRVFTSDIVNYTKKQIKKTSIEFEIPLGIIVSIEDLEKQLIQGLAEYHHQIEAESYFLRVVQIKKDYFALKFQYSLISFTRDLERQIKRKAVRHIIKIVSGAKIKEQGKAK